MNLSWSVDINNVSHFVPLPLPAVVSVPSSSPCFARPAHHTTSYCCTVFMILASYTMSCVCFWFYQQMILVGMLPFHRKWRMQTCFVSSPFDAWENRADSSRKKKPYNQFAHPWICISCICLNFAASLDFAVPKSFSTFSQFKKVTTKRWFEMWSWVANMGIHWLLSKRFRFW